MKIAAVALGIVGLTCTLIGTSEFVPFVRSGLGKLRRVPRAVADWFWGWIVVIWFKLFRPPWQAIVALLVVMGLAAQKRTASHQVHTVDHLGVSDSLTATFTPANDDLPPEAWRIEVNKQLRTLAAQLGQFKIEVAAGDAALRAEVTEHVDALRRERRESDQKAMWWISAGVFCQMVSAFLALFR